MTYVPRMQNTSAGWIGEGRLVYSTGNTPNMPFAGNPALLQARQNLSGGVTPNLPAVIQRPQYNFNFQQMINQQAGVSDFRVPRTPLPLRETPNLPVLYNGGNASNAGRTVVNLPVLSTGAQAGSGSSRVINLPVAARHNTSALNLPVVAERAASEGVQQLEVISQTVNEVNKPSIWKSLKNGIKNIFSKAKTFFKSPKGIFTLVTAAVVATGAALCGYVTNRFSDKNKPTPTSGPSKVFMPKLETEEQKSEKVNAPEETTLEKQETSSEVTQTQKENQQPEEKVNT